MLTCTCYPAVSILLPVQMHNLLSACSFVGPEAGISHDVPFFSQNGFGGFEIIHLTPSFEQALANHAQFPLYNYIFELYVAGDAQSTLSMLICRSRSWDFA